MKAYVHFVGLCSFVNIKNEQGADLPDPCVIVHRSPGHHHIPFVAWRDTQVTAGLPGSIAAHHDGPTTYVKLDGETITLVGSPAGIPDTSDGSFNAGVARFSLYAQQPMPDWNRPVVPKKGRRPDHKEVAAYIPLGSGTLTSSRPTTHLYIFADVDDPDDVSVAEASRYDREVTYCYDVSAELTIAIATAQLRFAPASGPDVHVWIGASMGVNDGINMNDPPTAKAEHFTFFYRSTTDNPPKTKYVPYIADKIFGGAGYCGPDNQP